MSVLSDRTPTSSLMEAMLDEQEDIKAWLLAKSDELAAVEDQAAELRKDRNDLVRLANDTGIPMREVGDLLGVSPVTCTQWSRRTER